MSNVNSGTSFRKSRLVNVTYRSLNKGVGSLCLAEREADLASYKNKDSRPLFPFLEVLLKRALGNLLLLAEIEDVILHLVLSEPRELTYVDMDTFWATF